MAKAVIDVRITLAGLDALRTSLRSSMPQHAAPFGKMFSQMGAYYAGFVRRRFVAYSRGGGDWPPLKPATIARRRRGKSRRRTAAATKASPRALGRRRRRGGIPVATGSAAILRDTGTLFNALAIGAPGNKFLREPNAIVYGFDGGQHPGRGGKAKATIAQIARWHNTGAAPNPRRLILAVPDADTIARMTSAVRTAIRAAVSTASAVGKAKGGAA